MFFKNGTLYIDNQFKKINFAVLNKKIQFRDKPQEKEKIIDLTNLIVSPGFVDIHIHTRTPGFQEKDDLDHITNSLIYGGFTYALAQSNTNPEPVDIKTWTKINKLIQKSIINITQAARITNQSKVTNIKKMSKYIKLFSDDGDPIKEKSVMKEALLLAKNNDVTLLLHEEDISISGYMYNCNLSEKLNIKSFNHKYESNQVKRDILLNEKINAKIHFQHISTYKSIKLITKALKDNMNVSAELTPHHLYFSNENITNDGIFKMNPPLPNIKSQKKLIEYFKKGLFIIATDHAPHEKGAKDSGFENSANGIIGLESSFAAVWTKSIENNIKLEIVLEAMTSKPALLLGIENYGIRDGNIANLTIIDPKEKWIFRKDNIYSKSSNSPFIGEQFTGRVKQIIINGKHIIL